MRARAPGKLVLSGAYSVLYGGAALVTAVDRYVVADSARPARYLAPEVTQALAAPGRYHGRLPPDFDASALRDGPEGQKLGLGSSAALTVASLAALELTLSAESRAAPQVSQADHQRSPADAAPQVSQADHQRSPADAAPQVSQTDHQRSPADAAPQVSQADHQRSPASDRELAARVFEPALAAHHAVHRGSGVDIAAACYGGTLSAKIKESGLELTARPLPSALQVEVYWSRRAASTSHFVSQVRRLAAEEPARFERLIGAQLEAAAATSLALLNAEVSAALLALRAQARALLALGAAAQIDIIIPELARALPSAPGDEAWLPAGAGGGDVTLRYYPAPSRPLPPSAIEALGERLTLSLGARGVHAF